MARSVLITAAVAALFLMFPFTDDTGGAPPSRGAFGQHDAGNFTVQIDDNGGFSGWNSLEFPIGQNRLSSAAFGLGTDPSCVDFGQRGDLVSKDALTISKPGNGTDEEGYCSFTGFKGQDFEGYNITQRTFVNNHTADTPGHTGRWMVLDYHIRTNRTLADNIYFMQMMDIDLGDPSNDNFIWDPVHNMAVTWEGTTFIGLAWLNHDTAYLHGHNAGEMTPSVFDGESAIFDHMKDPNNQSTSATGQNWYMDMVLNLTPEQFEGSARFGFVIVVGTSLNDLINAVNDAKYAMKGTWSITPVEGWQTGAVNMEAFHDGPVFSDNITDLWYILSNVDGVDFPEITYHPVRRITFTFDTSPDVYGWSGTASGTLRSANPWGYPEEPCPVEFDYDNRAPEAYFVHDSPADGTLHIEVVSDDHEGSGVDSITMTIDDGMDNITYYTGSIYNYLNEGGAISATATITDPVGNSREIEVTGLINDATAPFISDITLSGNITEKTQGGMTFHVSAGDMHSGLDHRNCTYQWGYGSPWSDPEPLSWDGDRLSGTVTDDWNLTMGSTLNIYVEVVDNVGHVTERVISEYIDPVNDPPEYNMSLSFHPFESDFIGITFEGFDPDGEGVGFEVQYNLQGTDPSIWVDCVGGMLVSLDQNHYKLMLEEISHEGVINIRSFVTDSKVKVEIPAQAATMDTIAPDLNMETAVPEGWVNVPIDIDMTVNDGGSGLASSWFFVSSPLRSTRVDGSLMSIEDEGVWTVSFNARDNSGNLGSEEIGTFMYDATPPSIWSLFQDPAKPGPEDDMRFNFRMADNLSGLDTGSTQLFISDTVSTWDLEADRLMVEEGLADIRLTAPFAGRDEGWYRILFEYSDNAGNSILSTLFTGELVQEPSQIPPIDLTVPEEIPVGEDWDVIVVHTGAVKLMARYPNTTRDWMFLPVRKEGDIRTFRLPGPCKGPVEIFLIFQENNTQGLTGRYPDEGVLSIPVVGFLDTDGDGLEDSWESRYGYDPLSPDDTDADADEDGLTLIMEMFNLTDPSKEDSDGDGMDDLWEAEWGTHPFRDDAWEDLDDDGWPNIKEYVHGTDPQDPEDHPEEPPATAWYWILMIVLVLLGIGGYFILQLFRKGELEKDLEVENDPDDKGEDHDHRGKGGSRKAKGMKLSSAWPDERDDEADWDG